MATHSINKFEYGDNTYLLEDNRISSYNSTNSGLIVDANGNLKIDPNYLAVSDALIFKGTLGTGGTVTSLPATHSVGDVYKVITEGTYAGHTCEEGDMVICITDGTTNNSAHWTVVQTNLDGVVIGPNSSTANNVAIFNGTTGKTIADSGIAVGQLPIGNITSNSRTEMTATVPGITELRDGICCYIKNNGNASSNTNWTLNVNGLGAKPVYSSVAASSRITTQFNANYTMLFIYNTNRVATGCWDMVYGYDSNTTVTYGTIDYYFRAYAGQALYRYKLVLQGEDHRIYPIVTTNQTSTTQVAKTPTTMGLRPGRIWFYNSTSTINAGAAIGAQTLQSTGYTAGAAYSFNTTVPTYSTIYLCGTYDKDKDLFYLYNNGSSPCSSYYTFVPNTASDTTLSDYFIEGKYYMLVGGSYSTTDYFTWYAYNPLYYFDGTYLIPFSTKIAKDLANTVGSHTHGNITNDGKLDTASKIVVTDINKNITTGTIDPADIVLTDDSRLMDARTPTSHTHGNITNDGKIGTAAHKVVVTGSNGVLTTVGPGAANTAFMGKGNNDAPGFVSVSPSSAWTGGTTNGPVLKITVLGVEQSTGATIPSASASASGIVTTGSQTFKGDKTFQSDTFRIRNTNANNSQAGTNPWVTQLNIGDGNYITITEYKDDQLAIRGSSILLNTQTIKGAYSSSSTYNTGDYVLYNGYYYRCTTAITTAEEWNASHWSQMPTSGIMASNNFTPWIDNTYSLGTSSYKWKNVYATTVHATLDGKINNGNTLGSSTKPIYLSSGTPTECTTYAGGTAVTLNGTSKAGSTASFYAPTAAGTANQILASSGSNTAPVWIDVPDTGAKIVMIDWTV